MSPAMKPRLRLAVIGCGKVAQNVHLPALARSSRCELVAVCDASREVAEGVGRRYAVDHIYDDVGDVLANDSVDAVIVAVGDPQHLTVTTQALEAGKHVLVEKPLGVSAAECRPLRDVVARTGKTLQVGVMKRHDPGVAYAKRAIQELGPLVSFSLWYRASADRYVDENAVFLPVFRDSQYRRPAYKLDRQPYYLATHGAHVFDMVRFVLARPVSVQAALAVHNETYSWHALLRLEDGTVGDVELTVYVESDWSEGFDVFGERGSVSVRMPNPFFLRPSVVRVFNGGTASWHEPIFPDGDPYLRQLDSFAASVLDGAPVTADVNDGIAALELIEAVAASVSAGGTSVDLEPARG
jgi:predicted dehydrogenase